jgi:hypothetical protein
VTEIHLLRLVAGDSPSRSVHEVMYLFLNTVIICQTDLILFLLCHSDISINPNRLRVYFYSTGSLLINSAQHHAHNVDLARSSFPKPILFRTYSPNACATITDVPALVTMRLCPPHFTNHWLILLPLLFSSGQVA